MTAPPPKYSPHVNSDEPPTNPSNSGSARRRAHFDLQLTDLKQDVTLPEGSSTRSNSPEPVHTPTLGESYSKLRRDLSFSSLRQLEAAEVKRALWRKGGRGEPGEEKYSPKNMDQVFAHAVRGASRSLVLAGSLRAGVNLVVLLLRVTKKKGIPAVMILRALFGPDTVRFAGMMGIFTFLYKQTLHTLRLFNPGKKGEGNEEWWHSAVAGAVSGVAVWAEKPSRRVTLGQQFLVRGLQGQYNIAKSKGLVNIPNGDVLLFGAACGQIMYSWLLAPESLPSGYRRWITNASRVAEPCLPVNHALYRGSTFDPNTARKAIEWKSGATPLNALKIENYAKRAEAGDFGPPFAPCEIVHPWVDSCRWVVLDRWQAVFRWMLPVYGALHVIPPILLRNKNFRKDPMRILTKSFKGTLRSCSFLATFVTLFQALICSQRNLYKLLHGRVPEWILEYTILSKVFYWSSGFSTCLALFLEEKKRRGELAMYVLPRGLESIWSILRRRSYVPFVPGGEIVLTSIGLSMVMSTYHNEPKMLSGLVRSVLYQFVGHG